MKAQAAARNAAKKKEKEDEEAKEKEALRMAAIVGLLEPGASVSGAAVARSDFSTGSTEGSVAASRRRSMSNDHNLLMKEKLDTQLDKAVNVVESGSFFDLYKLGDVVSAAVFDCL